MNYVCESPFAFVLSTESADWTAFVTSTTIFIRNKLFLIAFAITIRCEAKIKIRWQRNLASLTAIHVSPSAPHSFVFQIRLNRTLLFSLFVWAICFVWKCIITTLWILQKQMSATECVSWSDIFNSTKNRLRDAFHFIDSHLLCDRFPETLNASNFIPTEFKNDVNNSWLGMNKSEKSPTRSLFDCNRHNQSCLIWHSEAVWNSISSR